MDQVEVPEGSPAKSYHIRIDGQRAIVRERGEVDGLDPIFFGAPAPRAGLEIHSGAVEPAQAEVRGKNCDLMAALGEAAREGAHFDDGAAAVLKREVRLNCH